MGKSNSVSGQAVERRSLNVFVSVATYMVGAERIDGDQKYVWLGAGRALGFSRQQKRGQASQEQGNSSHFVETSIEVQGRIQAGRSALPVRTGETPVPPQLGG